MGLGWDWLGALVGGRHAQDWAGSRRLREDARCRAASYPAVLYVVYPLRRLCAVSRESYANEESYTCQAMVWELKEHKRHGPIGRNLWEAAENGDVARCAPRLQRRATRLPTTRRRPVAGWRSCFIT